ncbi:unnamed protein product [Closterium sp. Yama58-4]|nr:unnamed protein product [Closterium sp. Yama58-4]
MGAGGSEQVRWSEDTRDRPGRGGRRERDSKNGDDAFEFDSMSDNGNSGGSSRSSGGGNSSSSSSSSSSWSDDKRIKQGKSHRGESAESSPHNYNEPYHNEYSYNEYKYIPGWEWEEGEQEEEAAEAEFEAVARLWEEMEASGKVHPLSAPVGGLRWKQEAQERFPDLARTAGVFPYMGDVIEREELDTPYDYAPPPEISNEEEELDTPYDFVPPPEIDREGGWLQWSVCVFADSYSCVFPYMGDVIERDVIERDVIERDVIERDVIEKDVIEREELDTPYDYPPPPDIDSQVGLCNDPQASGPADSSPALLPTSAMIDKLQDLQTTLQLYCPKEEAMKHRRQQSQAEQEEPMNIFALGLVEEGVRVQNPVVCVQGRQRWQQWLQLVGSAGGHLHLHHLYSETLVKTPDRRWITALWTILLAKSGREAVAGMGLSDWWERNLPEHEAEIRRNLPAEEGQYETRGVQGNGILGFEKRRDKLRQADEEEDEEEDEQSRMNGGSNSNGGSDAGGRKGRGRRSSKEGKEGEGGKEGEDMEDDAIFLVGKTRFGMNTRGKISAVDSTWFIADDPTAVRETARGELFLRALLLKEEQEIQRQYKEIIIGACSNACWLLAAEILIILGRTILAFASSIFLLSIRFTGFYAMRHAALRVASASASKVSRRKSDLTRKSQNALSSVIPAPTPQILSSRAIGDARLDSFQEAAPPFAPIAPRFAASDAVVPLATSERRSVIPAVPFAARSYVSGTGLTAGPAAQPGSAASATAGSPIASAASADRASGPGSGQAGSERRGWNLLFGGGAAERGGQGAGGSGGGAAAEAEGKGDGGGGWLSRFQTFLRLGKGGGGKALEKKRLTHAEGLTEFANQLKRARQFGQLTTFGKSLPKGGQSVVTNSLRKQEVITLALAAYAAEAKLADERLSIPFAVRQRVASETGSTMGEIDMLLAKYEWFAEAANRMQELQDQGKPLPRSFAEIEQMMGGPWSPSKKGAGSGASAGSAGGAGSAGAPSRNSPCPCGSGKRYKRCCGAGTK